VSAEPDGVALSLKAERVCWVSLTVDGQRVAYRTLQAGDTVTARMRQRASLRTGDAGALQLTVAGGSARPLGGSGVVRSVEIAPDGSVR
jgi:hypothetical protein